MDNLEFLSNLLKNTNPLIDKAMPDALLGDRDSALFIINIASGLIRVGCPLPEALAMYISTGLHRIGSGLKVEDAFLFKGRGKGKPIENNTIRVKEAGFRRAFLVEILVASRNLSIEEARDVVANAENTSSDSVKHAWEEFHIQAKTVLSLSGIL